MRTIGLLFVTALFLISGLAHWLVTDWFIAIMPSYVPWPKEIVLVTGLGEIAGALALLHRRLRRIAGLALALFAVCVVPVHIDMLVHADRWQQVGPTLLFARLALQPVLVALILVVTWSRTDSLIGTGIPQNRV